MKSYIKYTITAILIAVSISVFYKKVYIPKISYKILSPSFGTLMVDIRAIGNVGAKDIYSITAQTGGKILAIHTDVGQWVKKGDLLIEIDGVDLPQQLLIAQANLQKAKYDVKAAQSDLLNQKVKKKLIQITYDRYTKLEKQKFASQSEFDKAKTDLESIETSISASMAHIDAAKAAVLVALRNIDALKIKLDRLKIYAPVDGYVISKNAQIAQNILPSTTILSIVDAKTLWVVAKIDERVSAKIRDGQKAQIQLRSQPEKTYKGVVSRINAVSDGVTLEREIDLSFINIPKPFYINEQAQVRIITETLKNVVKIPADIVVQKSGKLGVWLVQGERAYFKKLDIIQRNEDEIAVKNIAKNAKIITPDSHKKPLSDGMKIHL